MITYRKILQGSTGYRWFFKKIRSKFSGPCFDGYEKNYFTWCVFDSVHRLYGSYNGSWVKWAINGKQLGQFKGLGKYYG